MCVATENVLNMSTGQKYSAVMMRSLDAAKQAHKDNDIEASKAAHDSKVSHSENHSQVGGYIKSIVFGGLDGIITTFAVVAGAAGGGLSVDVILILGFSSVFADAVSMGVGDALSTKAENEYILAEKRREGRTGKLSRGEMRDDRFVRKQGASPRCGDRH